MFIRFVCDLDKKHESVILPVFGIPTPFHISTIKVYLIFDLP